MRNGIDRVFLVVLDSVGCGALPDADRFGDVGSDTLGHVARAVGGADLPNLARLGLGKVHPIAGVEAVERPAAAWGRMAEASMGKDTTTGHWEIAGLVTPRPFPTYPQGFPPEVMEAFERAIGRASLCNRPYSGTAVIDDFGPEHLRTGHPIVYTSADSVFQIAAHEEIVPIDTLYEWCHAAREILQGEHAVSRVIARPFVGQPGGFTRTARRKDLSVPPHGPTLLDHVKAAGQQVIGVGKISDIFAGVGLTRSEKTAHNPDGLERTLALMQEDTGPGLVFVNLVDFDTLYGHRNDPQGYYRSLKEFDDFLPRWLEALPPRDLLVLTADHGNDPTYPGTDHTREYVPLLAWGRWMEAGSPLGTRARFTDLGATVADLLGVEHAIQGESFAEVLR